MEKQNSVFAICDTEFEYACRFMEYLNQKRRIPFEVHAFTNTEELKLFAKKNPVEILLISERAMTSEIRFLPVQQIMILTEGSRSEEFTDFPNICKYQSSDMVIREVLACYGKQAVEARGNLVRKNRRLKVIGIFAPENQVRKTLFSLVLGQILAKEKAVLYLDLDPYSVLPQFLNFTEEAGIGEILYYVRQEKKGTAFRVRTLVRKLQNLDILPPVRCADDLLQATARDWEWFIRTMDLESDYEILLLDIGSGSGNLTELLELCNKVYYPHTDSLFEHARWDRFWKLLTEEGKDHLQRKLRKVTLSEKYFELRKTGNGVDGNGGSRWLESLVWKQEGEAIRKLLQGEPDL